MSPAWQMPAMGWRSYQSVIQSPAPKMARNPANPRNAHEATRGPLAMRLSSLSSHAMRGYTVAQEH